MAGKQEANTERSVFRICSWRNKLRQWFGQVACYLVFHCDIWSLIWNFTQSFFYAEMYYSHWHRMSNQSASVEGHKPLSLTIKSNMEGYMVWSAYFLRELGACIQIYVEDTGACWRCWLGCNSHSVSWGTGTGCDSLRMTPEITHFICFVFIYVQITMFGLYN